MQVLRIIVTVLFVITALAIITIVLLQEGKSAGLGSIGGAASAGNSTFWDKNRKHTLEGKFETWTKITAGIFMITAFILMLI